MSKPNDTTARLSYWSKIKKKNVYRSINIKKFGGDMQKAKDHLNKWKEEEQEKEKKMLAKKDGIEEIKEDKKEEDKKEEKKEEEEIPIINTIDTSVIEKPDKDVPPPIIQYTEFNLSVPDLKKDACSTVIYGSSKAGKTTQAIEILDTYFGENYVITLVFSPNIQAPVYSPLKGSHYIKIDRWDDQIIKDIHKIQKKTKNKYTFLVFIDDCILEKLSAQILQLLLVLRNSKINTLLNLQSVTLLSRNGRNNGNNFIFKNFNNDEVIKDAMDYFLGSYPPFYGLKMEQKIRLYKEITKDYGFVYLNALDGKITFHKPLL
jgi:hypothetical protein